MFDWIKRLVFGELDKDKITKWALEKIKEEEEEAIFKKKKEEQEELTGEEDST